MIFFLNNWNRPMWFADHSFEAKLLLPTPCLSDRVKIELGTSGGKPSPCHGDLYISVNDSYHAVCIDDTTSYKDISEVVCRELHCGTLLSVFQAPLQKQGQISHIECLGQRKSLWECIHERGIVGNCRTIEVVCSGNCNAHTKTCTSCKT